MIVKLTRSLPPGGPWLLYTDPDEEPPIVGMVDPTVEIGMLMGDDEQGYLEADDLDGVWRFKRRVEDQGW